MKEMKLMELAKLVNDMKVGETIYFVSGCIEEAEWNNVGCWCGVKRIDEFDNINSMYIVSLLGGEADAILYHISEFDNRIGDFCTRYAKSDLVACVAKMLADYLENMVDGVDEIITVN